MRLFALARPLVVAVALGGVLAGAGACTEGGGVALPSSLPSIERTAGPQTTAPDEEKTSSTPRFTRDSETVTTKATTKPATTKPAATAEPTRAAETTEAAEATTTKAEPPPATQAPAAQPSEVAATSSDTGMGALGWLVLLVVIGLAAVLGVVLAGRSRRTAAWESQAVRLAAATRTVSATRVPVVLRSRDARERAMAWSTVRADLTELAGRWGVLAGGTGDEYRRASAGQISTMLQDLVVAVDDENQALATGRDWRLIRARVQQIGDALDAALSGFVAPPQADPGADPYPA